MYLKGQRVVCVDDQFPGPLKRLYAALPVKGVTYTVRTVYVARGVAFPTSPGAADGEIGILLNELVNPPDPKNRYGQELGFKAERFAPLETLPDEEGEEPAEAPKQKELVEI